jgi:hypothetical protein
VAIDGIKVPLQQALMQGRVTYWHSPGAMWLFLGVCAFAGSIVAGFLRGWLTQATRAETPPPVLVGAFRRNE